MLSRNECSKITAVKPEGLRHTRRIMRYEEFGGTFWRVPHLRGSGCRGTVRSRTVCLCRLPESPITKREFRKSSGARSNAVLCEGYRARIVPANGLQYGAIGLIDRG